MGLANCGAEKHHAEHWSDARMQADQCPQLLFSSTVCVKLSDKVENTVLESYLQKGNLPSNIPKPARFH
jgi:hypothetical protein